MKIEQVAVQMYTLREYLKTPQDIASSLARVRAIGYRAVQLSGLGPIADAELVRMLAGEGLVCCATHEPGPEILDAPARVVERLQALGCRITAYPYPAGIDLGTLDAVRAFAARLDAAGRQLHAAGLVLCYHNHHLEFRRLEGQTVLEHLYSLTDPRHLQGEPDTYWVQYGGGDPVAWCERLQGRLPILHLKDYAIGADARPTFAAIGQGNLDWPRIIDAADAAGCQWYAVEQDTCPGDPFESLRQSFDYIQGQLCEEP